MRRWALALIIGSATPILTAQSPPTVTIELSERGNVARDRIDAAARLAMASYAAWLGPPPFERLGIRDSLPADVAVRIRWWEGPGQMWVESKVAEDIALAWLGRVTTNNEWKYGAAAYLRSRIVEQLFDREFFLKAHRYDGTCFFGCYVGWSFRSLPLDRSAGGGNRMGAAFVALERELGWPTLQGALRAAASGLTTDPIAAMSAATGRDLAPVFAEASSGGLIDRAISMSSEAGSCASPCYRTLVSIAPAGAVPFPLLVRLSFSDGQSIDARWDGRRDRLEFESAAPAIGAELDPDRVWLLDRNLLNNARVPPRETNVPVTKWMARWIVWLQDAILTHTFPV
ncbi:MAG TPA: hypothetical protein VL919_14790 [Vicinamibacterales bacterium]|nr:hypothetical protein [Vicinamibacterales bacterium]